MKKPLAGAEGGITGMVVLREVEELIHEPGRAGRVEEPMRHVVLASSCHGGVELAIQVELACGPNGGMRMSLEVPMCIIMVEDAFGGGGGG